MLRTRLESRGVEQAKTMGLADLHYCALKHDRNVVARLEISCNMESDHITGGGLFAECLLHSAKAALHSAKPLPSATLGKEPPSNPLPVEAALPSAKFRALGKDFAECRAGTRQRFDAVSLPSATAPALGKEICFF